MIGKGTDSICHSDHNLFKTYICNYDSLILGCNNGELVEVFKGLVKCEKYFGSCGSATPASRIYDEIRRLGLDTDYTLADWAFQYSDNEYIPFGAIRHGEKTAYEYIQGQEDSYNRIVQEQLNAQNRKAQQLKRAQEIAYKKRQTDIRARKIYQAIMSLPPEKQIQNIVNDSAHNILFYMPVINGLMVRTDVLQQDWEALLQRLSQLKVTPFNKRLIKNISSKLYNKLV